MLRMAVQVAVSVLCLTITYPSRVAAATVTVAICQIEPKRFDMPAVYDTDKGHFWLYLNGVLDATSQWHRWVSVAGPSDVIIDDPYSLKTNAIFPSPGAYVLELQGSDGGQMAYDTLNVIVK